MCVAISPTHCASVFTCVATSPAHFASVFTCVATSPTHCASVFTCVGTSPVHCASDTTSEQRMGICSNLIFLFFIHFLWTLNLFNLANG